MEDLNAGKTTLKTIWKTITFRSMSAQECMSKIFAAEKRADGWEHVLEYVTFYIPMIVFPRFKRDRGAQYFQFLSSFSDQNSKGSEYNIYVWNKIAFYSRTNDSAMRITD